jgi:PAS domain S-box-containing protein
LIKLEATTAHLWFEEIISGDSSQSFDDVLGHLDHADWYAKAMLEGGQSAEGQFFPLSDPHMRQDITEVRGKLAEFREITLQRWQTNRTAGIGTEIDQKYDAVFKDLIQQADLVETDLQQMIGKENNNFQIVQIVLIVLSLAITVVVGITFSRFLKNKIRHELELEAANLQLDAGNQQLMASEQQLKAANQQLTASEQQLKAANQQLTASEQQLIAANQQLTASEQEARALAKFPSENPNPVLRISKDNAVLYSNQAAEPILAAWGCEENRCLCLPDRESKLMKIALNSGKPAAFDLDHSNRTFSITLAPVPESDYVNIYAHDITNRKHSEDELRKSEEKYRQFYEDAPLGYQSLDASGNFLDVNREWLNVLGYSKEEVIGRCFSDFIASESLDTFVQNFPRFKAGGKTRATEFEMIKKDGSRVTVSFDGNIEYDQEGHFKRTHCIMHDITDRVKAQKQLLDYQGKLKSLASQLSVIEERERHRLATDLHDHIGQALVMSKMKLDSLRGSVSSGNSTVVLGEVCDCLGDIIRDTRTLTFDLSSPILYELGFETAVTEWLDEQIKEKHGIQTEFRDDGQPKPLDNDISALLFRNVRELLINIIKHAKAKKVKVSVGKVDEQICVIIEDDGIGFEPAKIDSNTGFGIFSIRERLEQLDGHLEIESEPGRGSRFAMTAPLKVEKSTEGV